MHLLETERLVLRAWRDEDAEDLFEYAKDPEVGPGAGWKPHDSIDESRDIINIIFKRTPVWAVVEKKSRKVIGSISLEDRMLKADAGESRELGYAIGRRYWNRGIVTEAVGRIIKYAFEEMNIELLFLKIFPENGASRRVALKCGFSYEGELRATFRNYDGELKPVLCYTMDAEKYALKKRGEEL